MADYYELLGVSRQATAEEIKKAYRRLARQLHPDANPGDSAAEERFKQVAKAYEVLGDPQARARYDRFGESGVTGGGGAGDAFGGGLGDLFDAFFGGSNPFGGGGRASAGGPPRGQDLEAIVNISLEQAVFGSTVPVQVRTAATCDECHGSGAGHGTQPVTCSDCNGRGQIQRMRQSLLGQMVTATMCPRCNGHGKVVVTPCPACNGEGRQSRETTYQVDVPAGVDTGSTLRLTGRGAVGPRGGGAGDLYVHVRVLDDGQFQRDGDDLVAVIPISPAQAALGTVVRLETFDGEVDIDVAAGTQPGKETVFRNRGVQHLRGRGRGDLRVRVDVDVPAKLTEQEADLYRQLAKLRGEHVGAADQGLFKRIKSAFQ